MEHNTSEPMKNEDCIKYKGEQLTVSTLEGSGSIILPALYSLCLRDFDLRATHARTLLPAALASVPFGFVLVRVLKPKS